MSKVDINKFNGEDLELLGRICDKIYNDSMYSESERLKYGAGPYINYYESIVRIKDHNDSYKAVMHFMMSKVCMDDTPKKNKELHNFIFIMPLEKMPLYLKNDTTWKEIIAEWRLKIAK